MRINSLSCNSISNSQQKSTSFQGDTTSIIPLSKEPVPKEVCDLFRQMPKTDLHLHLSGSAPLPFLKKIMQKGGLSPEDIRTKLCIPDEYKDLADFLRVYCNTAWGVNSPQDFKEVTHALCTSAAEENVQYLEIRTSVFKKGSHPDEILQAVTDGIQQAKGELAQNGFEQTAKIIVLAQRHESAERSMEHAQIAARWVQKPDSLVVGFDLAGDEGKFPSSIHKDAIEYARANGVNVTVHAGENLMSGSFTAVQSMNNALDYGTNRLGHAIYVLDDPILLKRVVDNQIPVESTPVIHHAVAYTPDMTQHPIKRKLDAGVLVSVSTDNRTLAKTNSTREFIELFRHNVVNRWEDIKKLIINGPKSAFLPELEKQKLIQKYNMELGRIEENPKFQQTIARFLTTVKNFK